MVEDFLENSALVIKENKKHGVGEQNFLHQNVLLIKTALSS